MSKKYIVKTDALTLRRYLDGEYGEIQAARIMQEHDGAEGMLPIPDGHFGNGETMKSASKLADRVRTAVPDANVVIDHA